MSSMAKVRKGVWEVRWRTPDGASRRKRFTKEGEASKHLARISGAIEGGTYVDAAAGRKTFREYAEDWRAAQVHRPTSQAHVETMLRKHAYPTFGDRAIASVMPSQVQAWVKRLSVGSVDPACTSKRHSKCKCQKPLAPSTVAVAHGLVAAVYKAAVKDKIVTSSPCTDTKLPKPAPRRIEPLSTELVEALAAAVPRRYRAAVILAAGTGLRQGEVFGLTFDRLDQLRKSLRVDRQLVTVPGRSLFLGPPKTDASYRTIPLPEVVVLALAAHLSEFPAEPQPISVVTDGRESSEPVRLIFTGPGGDPIRRTHFGHTWRDAVASAGVSSGFGFHGLRHYYASLLIRHGESVKVVQTRLGHATAAETLDTYSHLWPDSEDTTRAAIDEVLGAFRGTGVSQAEAADA